MARHVLPPRAFCSPLAQRSVREAALLLRIASVRLDACVDLPEEREIAQAFFDRAVDALIGAERLRACRRQGLDFFVAFPTRRERVFGYARPPEEGS